MRAGVEALRNVRVANRVDGTVLEPDVPISVVASTLT